MKKGSKSSKNTQIGTVSIKNRLVTDSGIHVNLAQDVIVTTADKVKLCLSEHLGRMEKKRAWMTPLAALVTIVITFVTATFKDWVLSAAVWCAVFLIAGVISLFWLLYAILQAIKSTKIEDIVEELKMNSRTKVQSSQSFPQ